jgi:hypothetical protein
MKISKMHLLNQTVIITNALPVSFRTIYSMKESKALNRSNPAGSPTLKY